ncbi:MAG: hypothetical protein Q9161_008566 [Pseudevernia consocians]
MKDVTAAKNQRILDITPAQYKDLTLTSTKGWRDFNKGEIKNIKDGAIKNPQQGPKGKRAAEAKKEAKRLQEGEESDEERDSQDIYFEYAADGVHEEGKYVSPAFHDQNTASSAHNVHRKTPNQQMDMA